MTMRAQWWTGDLVAALCAAAHLRLLVLASLGGSSMKSQFGQLLA